MSFTINQVGPKSAAIVVGLRWVVLQSKAGKSGAGKSASAAIRRQGSSVRASLYTLNPLDPGVCGFNTKVFRERSKGGSYSLAALFLNILKDASLDDQPCVLLMQPPSMPGKRALICVDNRQIEVDALLDAQQALEQVQARLESNSSIRVFSSQSSQEVLDFESIALEWSDIAELVASRPAGALRPLPINPWVPGGVILAAACALGYYAHHSIVVKPAQQARLAEDARQRDKTPQYIQLVIKQLERAGWDREDLIRQIRQIERQPALIAGWLLDRVDCDQSSCRASWKRHGGTLAGLTKAVPDQSIVHEETSLTSATTTWKIETKTLGAALDKLLTAQSAQSEVFPAFQVLANVGVQAAMNEPQKWGGDLFGVSPSAIVHRAPVEIVAPLHHSYEVLRMLPESVYITSFTVQVGNDLRISMKGSVYVK